MSHRGWPHQPGLIPLPSWREQGSLEVAARYSKSMGHEGGLESGWGTKSWVRQGQSIRRAHSQDGHGHDAAAMETGWDSRSQGLSLKLDPA